MAALTARLGVWQLDRAAQKEALQAQLDARGHQPTLATGELPLTESTAADSYQRPARVLGEWVQGATVFLDNRQMNGRPGFFVVTPLRLDPSSAGANDAVLVQRGWVPRDLMDRQRVPEVPTPPGPVELVGRIAPPPARLYDFAAASAASGPIRQNLDLAQFAGETRLALRPFSLQQTEPPATQDGLLRQWPPPAVDIHKHYGYATQWFALSALVVSLYVWFQLVRPWLRRRA